VFHFSYLNLKRIRYQDIFCNTNLLFDTRTTAIPPLWPDVSPLIYRRFLESKHQGILDADSLAGKVGRGRFLKLDRDEAAFFIVRLAQDILRRTIQKLLFLNAPQNVCRRNK
jgi:hypothetical protein